jgi:hypothetical protein
MFSRYRQFTPRERKTFQALECSTLLMRSLLVEAPGELFGFDLPVSC